MLKTHYSLVRTVHNILILCNLYFCVTATVKKPDSSEIQFIPTLPSQIHHTSRTHHTMYYKSDQVTTIEGKKADQLVKITAEIKDKDELATKKRELDERCQREITNQTNRVTI